MAATKYIIQWAANPSYCLGIPQANSGQVTQLTILQGAGNPNTQWECDPNTGVITSAANPALCLDISGNNPGNQVAVIVANYVLGRSYQTWNWLGRPGWLMNNGAPGFYLDNYMCQAVAGNPVQIYDASGRCQGWTLIAVPAVQAVLARHQQPATTDTQTGASHQGVPA
jgi:hypothetical protein